MGRGRRLHAVVLIVAALGVCSSSGPTATTSPGSTTSPAADTTAQPTVAFTTQATAAVTASTEAPAGDELQAGAASRSVLPTVDNARAFVGQAPGWPSPANATPFDQNDPGVYVPAWDQGRVDVGNGSPDAAWVHDDLRVAALALERGDQRVVLVSADVYMVFSVDADEIAAQAHDLLPPEWADAPILIAATHNHHGPDTAFSVNDSWYDLFATEAAGAVVDAVDRLEPATIEVASGEHRFGVNDARDPVVLDPSLRLLLVRRAGAAGVIASVVQWTSHPETTLGWNPPEVDKLERICADQGWAADDCTAEGRYFTADYPGVLRDHVQRELGGEVLYFNGPLGSQIGPGEAPVWLVDAAHPVGNGWTVPDGAVPLGSCADSPDPFLCRSFAKTEAIGARLADAVVGLADSTRPVDVTGLTVRREDFFTRMTNIGFRVLLADGDLGWRPAPLYTCSGEEFSAATCTDDGGATEDDPVLTPLTGSQVRHGDVLQTRLVHLDLGDVGFMFMPGELPPELVVGLPADFDAVPGKYSRDPVEQHATGSAYEIPGYLLSLVDESTTFTVGLGTEELGYWVPVSDYRLRCLEVVLPEGVTCQGLHADGLIEYADAASGATCKQVTDDPSALAAYPAPADRAIAAICRYGQAIGRELGEPPGHYEETNAAGWDLVDDLWAAATRLFGRQGTGRLNPANAGYTPEFPPLS